MILSLALSTWILLPCRVVNFRYTAVVTWMGIFFSKLIVFSVISIKIDVLYSFIIYRFWTLIFTHHINPSLEKSADLIDVDQRLCNSLNINFNFLLNCSILNIFRRVSSKAWPIYLSGYSLIIKYSAFIYIRGSLNILSLIGLFSVELRKR